jgi:uncharacterized coiled-coil DUF342 family protein
MTLNELKGKYARLQDEIDSIEGAGEHSESRLARLTCELDQIDQELAAFSRRAREAPTLRDVVEWADPFATGRRVVSTMSLGAE